MPDPMVALLGLADKIVSDAAGIIQLRTKTAQMKASADIDTMNADFMATLKNPMLDPSTVPSLLQDQEAKLQDYADSFEFAPARASIQAMVAQTRPQLHTQSAAIVNRVQLGRAVADFNSSLYAVQNDPNLSPDERYQKTSSILEQGKTHGFLDPVKLGEIQQGAYRDFRVQKLSEVANAQGGLASAVNFISSPERLQGAGFGDVSQQEINQVIVPLTQQLSRNSEQAVKDFSSNLVQQKDTFVDPETAKAQINGRQDISPAAKESMLSLVQAHNDDALYTTFIQRINNTTGPKTLQSIIDDLKVEGEWKGEQWIGSGQETRRGQLLNMAQSKLAAIAGGGGPGGASDGAKTEAWQIYWMYKNGQKGPSGDVVTYGVAMNALAGLSASDKALPEIKSAMADLESFVPINAQSVFGNLKKTLDSTTGGFQKTPDGKVAGAWMADAFADYMKSNPTASQDQYQKAANDIQAVYKAKELGFIRGKKAEEGLFNPASKTMYEIGAAAQTGKLDAAVSFDPASGKLEVAPIAKDRYQQWSSWEPKVAADKYGLAGLVPRTQEDGAQYLEDPSGKKYRFDYQNGEQVLRSEGGTVIKPKATPEEKAAKAEDLSTAQTDVANARNPADRKAKIEYWVKRKVLTLEQVAALGYNADGNRTSYSAIPQGIK